jgi:uncharacterized protein
MNNDRKPLLSGQHPLAMLIFSSLGVVLVGLLFQLAGLFLSTGIFDVSTFDLLGFDGEADQNVIRAVKLLQIVGALGTFVVSSFLLSFLYTGSWYAFFPFGKQVSLKLVLLLILIMLTALPFVNFLTEWNTRMEIPIEALERYFRQMEEQTQELMMALVQADKIPALLVNLFMIALIPAVGEELVFRGLVQRHLTDLFKSPHLAIVVASVIFSLVHFQIYSFLPRFFLGLLLGYLFYYGKTIWYPMIGHLVNNSLGVVFYYMVAKGSAGTSLEEIGTGEMVPSAALFSLLIVGILMFAWVKAVRDEQRGLTVR